MSNKRYTSAEAVAMGLEQFESKFPCQSCGLRDKFVKRGKAFCVYCNSFGPCLSAGKIKTAQNIHNRVVRKKMKQNFCIPVVFSGMNTGTR